MIKMRHYDRLRALNNDKNKSIYSFQGLIILNREDQFASFESLVDHFEKGPPTYGQPGLSGLVVGGPKWYNNYGPSDPKINACQDPA